METKNFLSDKMQYLKEYCEKYQVKTMYVFGSVLTPNFSQTSDVDVLISFKNIPIETYTDNYFNLHTDLEQLFNRSVDLLTENSLKNPFFIQSIEQNKQLIYAS